MSELATTAMSRTGVPPAIGWLALWRAVLAIAIGVMCRTSAPGMVGGCYDCVDRISIK
jgi:hypothetical protein